jgi:hypothetical protein
MNWRNYTKVQSGNDLLFFSQENTKTLLLFSLKMRKVQAFKRWVTSVITRIQCTPQVAGMITLRPAAPALAQSAASALILSRNMGTEGLSLSKTQAFRCFQIIQAVGLGTWGGLLGGERAVVERAVFSTPPSADGASSPAPGRTGRTKDCAAGLIVATCRQSSTCLICKKWTQTTPKRTPAWWSETPGTKTAAT